MESLELLQHNYKIVSFLLHKKFRSIFYEAYFEDMKESFVFKYNYLKNNF